MKVKKIDNEEIDKLTFPMYSLAVKIQTNMFFDKLKLLETIYKPKK